jgi:hypothetical protein
MRQDSLKWASGEPTEKLVTKETLNHRELVELVSGLDVYQHTAEAYRRAYQALGIDIVNRMPLESAPHQPLRASLVRMADASREVGVRQVVSLFPDVPPEEFDSPAFVVRVNCAVALCYCLGLLPLYPYDVWAGPGKPRWFGRWEDYRASYEIVREHPEWFDDYEYVTVAVESERTTVVSRHREDGGDRLEHVIDVRGNWQTRATCLQTSEVSASGLSVESDHCCGSSV